MRFRPSEIFPLLAIGIGMIVAQSLGLQGPTTTFFALFAILAAGYYAGPRLIQGGFWTTFRWGSLSALAVLMLMRGAWFYAGGALNTWGDAWTTVGMLVTAIVCVLFLNEPARNIETKDESSGWGAVWEAGVVLMSIVGFATVAYAAAHHATTQTIRTPWPLMPWWTLPVVGGLWALMLATAWRIKSPRIAAIQAACAIGATVVITPLIYTIGYGFDGFLHVAGETVLLKTGLLTPKPPYYMGQYVFVTWIARLFDLDIGLIDRWLVPAAAMILIPAAALVDAHVKPKATLFAALILIPLGALITTTPNGFATVLAIVAVILTIRHPERSEAEPRDPSFRAAIIPLIFALWSTLTHPLIGLPILCAIFAWIMWHERPWMRWALGLPAAIGAGISVPLVFGLASHLGSSAGVNFDIGKLLDPNAWQPLVANFIPWVPNRFALWPQAAQWIVMLLPWVVIIFVVSAVLHKRDENEPCRYITPWIIAGASTFVAAVVLSLAGDFGFLIDYERGNYADRLFMVALLLLLPVAIPELAKRLVTARSAPFLPRIAVLVAVGLLGAGASYAALPRHDAIVPSRGWSVGQADIDAVKLIDQDAHNQPYTVLADQSVSAAAVKTFGFKRYNGDVFFYPIPTGGPLYNIFLQASYEDPTRDTMREAGRLGGSNLVYFVVNDYWWDADNLSEKAASSTDREFVIDDGKVNVFKYQLK